MPVEERGHAGGGARLTAERGPGPGIAEVGEWVRGRSGLDSLPAHLRDRYGVEVTGVSQLDVGVLRVDRSDGPSWVVRVFPSARPLAEVEGDARILRGLERGGFPAERCAVPDPVSVLEGQGVLVTLLVSGEWARQSGRTFGVLGELLGRLHASSESMLAGLRPGGAWHHLCLAGGPGDEMSAALRLLDECGARLSGRDLSLLHRLREALETGDGCEGLPEALLHPDFVPANALVGAGGHLTLVDWTGAGRGPRLWSLAFLLRAAGAWSVRYVDPVVTHYARHVRLRPDELSRLGAAVRSRSLVLDAWAVSLGRRPLDEVVAQLPAKLASADAAAARAVQLLEGDLEAPAPKA
jgi:Ser/Thr protein kinase RdoA (MazF antagonist)